MSLGLSSIFADSADDSSTLNSIGQSGLIVRASTVSPAVIAVTVVARSSRRNGCRLVSAS